MSVEPKEMRAELERLFQEIESTRMEGVPVLNKALSVAAFGFDPYLDYHLGVLLTPWFMNVMLVPLNQEEYAENPPQVGDKQMITIPAGQVEFIVGYEESLGYSLSCSLFSPVFEFEDQAAARDTALAALDEILNEDCETEEHEAEMRDIWAGRLPDPEPVTAPDSEDIDAEDIPRQLPSDVSRRDFLRGGAPSAKLDSEFSVEDTA